MTIKIANSSPGDTTDPYVPGKPLLVGLRSTTQHVDPISIRYDLALSCLVNNGVLPEVDTKISDTGAVVSLDAPELERPTTGEITRTITGGSLVLTKVGAGASDLSVYSVKIPVETGSSVLGHFKIRINTAWQSLNPDWCNLTNMKGPFFGLEYGPLNTSACLFFRDNGANGSLVVGGPQQGPTLVRPEQAEITSLDPDVATGWKTLANGTAIDLFIVFNMYSNPNCVEFWAALPAGPVKRIGFITTEVLSTFPAPGNPGGSINTRTGPSNFATLYFGLSGLNGDVLQIDDWGLFPNYRRLTVDGSALSNAGLELRPNGPVTYSAADRLLPTKERFARWLPMTDGALPQSALFYQPGRQSKPLHVAVTGNGPRSGFQRNEPRLEVRSSGAMLEGILSGVSTSRSGSGTSMGIGIEDGDKSYRLLFIEDPNLRTIGLLKDEALKDSLAGYNFVSENDWTAPQLVRLTIDRSRSEIVIYAGNTLDENEPALTLPLTSVVPLAPSATGRMMTGFLTNLSAQGQLNIQSLLYLAQYSAWEGRDGAVPGAGFTGSIVGAGTATMVGGKVSITKPDFGVPSSSAFYSKSFPFKDRRGLLVDFKGYVPSYTNVGGVANAPLTDSGVGVRCFLGNRVLQLGFFDCGLAGKKVGIIPGSGSALDIVNQTSLGVKFSATVDWTQSHSYRLVMKPYESIQLWVDTVFSEPILTIPWVDDQFDIPTDTTASSIQFGHFSANTSSVSNWRYIRWGCSDGYDASITENYPTGRPRYLFGGKIFSALNFNEII